jgi:hypothetical protein
VSAERLADLQGGVDEPLLGRWEHRWVDHSFGFSCLGGLSYEPVKLTGFSASAEGHERAVRAPLEGHMIEECRTHV